MDVSVLPEVEHREGQVKVKKWREKWRQSEASYSYAVAYSQPLLSSCSECTCAVIGGHNG